MMAIDWLSIDTHVRIYARRGGERDVFSLRDHFRASYLSLSSSSSSPLKCKEQVEEEETGFLICEKEQTSTDSRFAFFVVAQFQHAFTSISALACR